MSITVHPACGDETSRSDGRERHVGDRYLSWDYYVEPGLTAQQKARALDTFAAEFASLPPDREPYEGWGDDMAYLCRRAACRHRGEPVGAWVPTWERRHAQDSGVQEPLRQVS